MRIAIYEPEPRVCGPMAWAYHLQHGLRELGHGADVITFTRSGKSRVSWNGGGTKLNIRWCSRPPDVVARMMDAAWMLRCYDRVILSNVHTVTHDSMAKKGTSFLNPGVPDYLTILERSGCRFTTALHGYHYEPATVPFAKDLLSLPGFCGTGVTHSFSSIRASHDTAWPSVTWTHSPLPYQLASSPDDDTPSRGTSVGITGRFENYRGHSLMALLAGTDRISGPDVEVWGSCTVGRGPSPTYLLFETLTQELGLAGHRYGDNQSTPAGGNVLTPYPWDVHCESGNMARYLGGYQDVLETCQRLRVHADLIASGTSSFDGEGVEFSQLEAIDAGCSLVSTDTMWHPELRGSVMPSIRQIPGIRRLLGTEEHLLDMVADTIMQQLTLDSGARMENVKNNRGVISRVNDPAAVAGRFIEVLE